MDNVIITKYSIYLIHGCLTMYIDVRYGNGDCQGFGGRRLLKLDDKSYDYGGRFIYGIMKAIDVKNLDQIVGKSARVISNEGGIVSIGHIIDDDKWFDISSLNDGDINNEYNKN
jgi:hypothetical protein